MRIISLLLILTIVSCSEHNNDFDKYNELEQKAMLEFADKEYEKALSNFDKAIKLKPKKDVSIYFFAAASALNTGNKEKAKALLIASIHNTNASKNYFLNFDKFASFRNEKLFTEIENEYENHVSEFYNQLKHPKIYREVDSLFKIDQRVRKNGNFKGNGKLTDSLNIQRLIEITKAYGWQKKGWLILWHQRGTYGEDNYVWNFFKPYINEQIAKGKMEKDFWTMFEEERSIALNKKQIYGLYWNQFNEYPIHDIENVDKRRVENGLPPLWYMIKVYDIEVPAGYKK